MSKEIVTKSIASNSCVRILKLTSGEEVAGIFVGIDTANNLIMSHPMVLVQNNETGSVKLNRYISFSDDLFHCFNYNTIVVSSVSSPEFEAYYNNNVWYHNKYEAPVVRETLLQVTRVFENALNSSTQEFLEAAKEYKVDLSTINKQRLN